MLEETHALSSKIKINAIVEKPENSAYDSAVFYMKYSSFVFKSLKRPSFQKFLQWMLRREKIEEQMIQAVDVNVFPVRRKNGRGLAGNCDISQGKIRIYPKTTTFCKAFKQKFGKTNLSMYVGSRARAALIHELLHLKYATDENKVRKLAKEYFFTFTRNKSTNSSQSLTIYTMIFRANPFETLQVYEKSGQTTEPVKFQKAIRLSPKSTIFC